MVVDGAATLPALCPEHELDGSQTHPKSNLEPTPLPVQDAALQGLRAASEAAHQEAAAAAREARAKEHDLAGRRGLGGGDVAACCFWFERRRMSADGVQPAAV
jgi:hypothetical protein